MSTPSTPPRFRFSLITLIIAVNVAGIMLWVKLRTSYSEWADLLLIAIYLTAFTALLVRKLRKAKRHDE